MKQNLIKFDIIESIVEKEGRAFKDVKTESVSAGSALFGKHLGTNLNKTTQAMKSFSAVCLSEFFEL